MERNFSIVKTILFIFFNIIVALATTFQVQPRKETYHDLIEVKQQYAL